MKVDHISFTQVQMYLRCPRAYYYRYIKGLKIPPRGSLILGKAVHFGIEVALKEKKETAIDPPISLVDDAFHEAWEANIEENETIIWDEKPEKIKDDGYKLARKWHKTRLPKTEPLEIEVPVEVEFKNTDLKLKAVVDLIDRNDRIVDYKVRKRRVNGEAKNSLQLSIYLLALSKLKGEKVEIAEVAIENLIRKKEPEIVIDTAKRTWKHVEFALDTISQVVKAIEQEIFPPSPGNRLCSPNWCGYWKLCLGQLEEEQ